MSLNEGECGTENKENTSEESFCLKHFHPVE